VLASRCLANGHIRHKILFTKNYAQIPVTFLVLLCVCNKRLQRLVWYTNRKLLVYLPVYQIRLLVTLRLCDGLIMEKEIHPHEPQGTGPRGVCSHFVVFGELLCSSFTNTVGNYMMSNDWIIVHNDMNVQESVRSLFCGIIPALAWRH
jgi:hypothetical protein